LSAPGTAKMNRDGVYESPIVDVGSTCIKIAYLGHQENMSNATSGTKFGRK
jgi:hypothetical protein